MGPICNKVLTPKLQDSTSFFYFSPHLFDFIQQIRDAICWDSFDAGNTLVTSYRRPHKPATSAVARTENRSQDVESQWDGRGGLLQGQFDLQTQACEDLQVDHSGWGASSEGEASMGHPGTQNMRKVPGMWRREEGEPRQDLEHCLCGTMIWF